MPESREHGAPLRIGVGVRPSHHGGKPPHAVALLCARRERPRGRAAEQRNKISPPHSITSSVRASNEIGGSRPSALAVLRLITSSNLVAYCTGSSPGFSPLRMRSTYDAARR